MVSRLGLTFPRPSPPHNLQLQLTPSQCHPQPDAELTEHPLDVTSNALITAAALM